jgi:4-amino-4-deoxy-L-arabinose transferase-like glycosyltransferase
MFEIEDAPQQQTRRLCERFTPVILAVFFALWGLRGATGTSIADYDAPRHAMNGAFMLDLVRHGQWAHAVQYGYWYYSRLPALSLPYHPPVFPAFEALVFAAFGVNTFAARLAIALATFAAVVLLYKLVLRTHQSQMLAACVTITMFALPRVQRLSATVMLEVPAMVFVLAAFFFITPDDDAFWTPRSLLFALFASAAIWTKQTVFLFLIPFMYVGLFWRWKLVRRPYFWISVTSIALSGVCLSLLGRELGWNGINQSWAKMKILDQVIENSHFYLNWKISLALFFMISAVLTYRLPAGNEDFRRERAYISWFLSVLLLLMVAPAYSFRYLYFAFPPLLVILLNSFYRILRPWLHDRAWMVPALLPCAVLASGLTYPPTVLRGPAEAAQSLHDAGYRRTLFCGTLANGAFIFAVRSFDPSLNTIVIRGDKLPASTVTPEALNSLIRKYGIDSVVLEHVELPEPWDQLSPETMPFLSRQRVVTMADTDHYMEGTLSIYRVISPTNVPDTTLKIPSPVIGRDVDLHF